jgi:hypothetical protein
MLRKWEFFCMVITHYNIKQKENNNPRDAKRSESNVHITTVGNEKKKLGKEERNKKWNIC